MKKILVLLCLMLTSLFLEAQTTINYKLLSNTAGSIGSMDVRLEGLSGVKGTPYLFENWNNNAILFIENGRKLQAKSLNFNIENSKFSFKISKDSIFTFHNIDRVEVKERVFIKLNNKFYERLVHNEKCGLMKEYSVKVVPEEHIITGTVIGPGKYVKENKYFHYSNGELSKINLRKKDIIEILKSKKELVLKYAKRNKLSFKNEEDIVKFFKYYNEL